MDKKILRNKVCTILSYKNLDLNRYNYVLKLLDKIRNDDSMKKFYYNSMGKLLLKQGNYEDAKYYFFELLSNYPDYFSSYYHFYKIDVYEHNFIDAYLDLFYYKQEFNSDSMDVTLPLSMVEMCLDLEYASDSYFKSDYSIDNTSKYFEFVFDDINSNELYNDIINRFNNRDYYLLYDKLVELDNLVEMQDLSIDVKPMVVLAEYIKNKVDEIKSGQIDKMIETGIYNDEVKNYFVKNIESKKLNINKIYKYINKLVGSNVVFSKWLLLKLENNYKIDDDIDIYNYLKFRIDEEISYLNLCESDKEIYNQCIGLGREAYNNGELDKALEYYQNGKQVTNHSIFDYYIGKMNYKKGNYNEAYEILSDYEKHGGNKLLQASLYLYTIDKKNNRNKKANKRANKIEKISSFFDEEWKIYSAKRNNKKVDIDYVKKNQSRCIRLSEEIFNEKALSIEDYYDYSFYDKLEIIKQLYQSNRIKMADSLMKELEKSIEDSSLKKTLNREKSRRILYINQAKKRI